MHLTVPAKVLAKLLCSISFATFLTYQELDFQKN